MSPNASFEFIAEARHTTGTRECRRLRRRGQVPAVVYGANQEMESITLAQKDVLKTIQNSAVFSSVLTLKINNKSCKAVIKALTRHETKPEVLHMDFLRIKAGEKITMHVPLHFLGEDKCQGVKDGGVISHNVTDLEVRCLPEHLPQAINIDVSGLKMHEAVHLLDIKLPHGVELLHASEADEEHNIPIVSVHAPRVETEEEEAAPSVAEESSAGEKLSGEQPKPEE